MASKEQRNARARDNQRNSRARRMEYIVSLESKIRQFETEGVAASQHLQASARSVEKQNSQLRAWLCRATGVREAELHDWLKAPAEVADRLFSTYLTTRGSSSTSGGATIAADCHRGTSRSSDTVPFEKAVTKKNQPYSDVMRPHDPEERQNWSLPISRVEPWLDSTTGLHQHGQQTASGRSDNTYPIEHDSYRSVNNSFVPQMPPLNHQLIQNCPSYPQSRSASVKTQVRLGGGRDAMDQNAPEVESQVPMQTLNRPLFDNVPPPSTFGGSSTQMTSEPESAWCSEDPQFPNFLSLLGTDSFTPSCGSGLSETGQQFCMLLSLLAPTSPASAGQGRGGAAQRQLTCRESYQALQHILGGRMSVEEVVGKLMKSATVCDKEGSMVDVNVVKEILDSIGVEAGGTCARVGACC